MKITHCRLKRNTQFRLLEYFVLEVTARSAADLLVLHPNSAVLFIAKYEKLLHLIFKKNPKKYLMVLSSWTRVILVEHAKAKGAEVQQEK